MTAPPTTPSPRARRSAAVNGGGTSTANYPTTFSNYPSNFDTFGGNIPTGIWYWTPAQLAAYNSPNNVNRDPITRLYYQYLFAVHEKNTAAFVQADFKGDNWAANVGVRYVHTQEDAISFTQVDKTTPGAILTSAFGPFAGLEREHNYKRRPAEREFEARSESRFGGALRRLEDHDACGLLGARGLHQPHTAGSPLPAGSHPRSRHRLRCRQRFGRQP